MALAIAVAASKREGFFNPRTFTPHVAPDIFTSELEVGEPAGGDPFGLLDVATDRYNRRAG